MCRSQAFGDKSEGGGVTNCGRSWQFAAASDTRQFPPKIEILIKRILLLDKPKFPYLQTHISAEDRTKSTSEKKFESITNSGKARLSRVSCIAACNSTFQMALCTRQQGRRPAK